MQTCMLRVTGLEDRNLNPISPSGEEGSDGAGHKRGDNWETQKKSVYSL